MHSFRSGQPSGAAGDLEPPITGIEGTLFRYNAVSEGGPPRSCAGRSRPNASTPLTERPITDASGRATRSRGGAQNSVASGGVHGQDPDSHLDGAEARTRRIRASLGAPRVSEAAVLDCLLLRDGRQLSWQRHAATVGALRLLHASTDTKR
jgi:hypothetical protein